MAENKTQKTDASVTEFLDSIEDETKRKDSYTLLDIYKKATKAEPKMWGSAIIGYGDFHYMSESGREGDWFLVGFSPRKQNLTLYGETNGWDKLPSIEGLGKYTLGGGCLYIKRLDDVNVPQLKKLIAESISGSKKMAKVHAQRKADQEKKKASAKKAKPKK